MHEAETLLVADSSAASVKEALRPFFEDGSNYDVEDLGIGRYEYGGAIGYDSNVQPVYVGPDVFELDGDDLPDQLIWRQAMPIVDVAGPAGTEWRLRPSTVDGRRCYVLEG